MKRITVPMLSDVPRPKCRDFVVGGGCLSYKHELRRSKAQLVQGLHLSRGQHVHDERHGETLRQPMNRHGYRGYIGVCEQHVLRNPEVGRIVRILSRRPRLYNSVESRNRRFFGDKSACMNSDDIPKVKL